MSFRTHGVANRPGKPYPATFRYHKSIKIARVGVEPTDNHEGLRFAAFPFAYRADFLFSAKSSSSGIRTHSISDSKSKWSANCLPSHVVIDMLPVAKVPRAGIEPAVTRV